VSPLRVFALALATAASCAAGPRDAIEVRRCYAAFARAVAERDGEAGAALLSEASLREWERDRRVALHGSVDEVEALPPGPRLLVLALRHQAPVFLLRGGTPRELAVHALASGLVDRGALAGIELGDVALLARGRASALVLAAGLPSGVRAGFVRERGGWRLDLPSSLDSAGRVVRRTAQATGASESAVIVRLIAALSGEAVGGAVWQPLVGDRASGGPPSLSRGGRAARPDPNPAPSRRRAACASPCRAAR
jgi:hypothetical protein